MSPARVDPLAIQAALSPLSAVYGSATGLRNRMYDRGLFKTHKLPVPVICVGNITTGGTGKTPLTALVAAHLQGRGLRVAVLSRGYGRLSREEPLVVSEGAGALVSPDQGGDEPVLLAGMLAGVPVVVGADRVRSGRYAHERFGAQVLVLDDGFQHRRLARDLDIVVLDCFDPFGRYALLPSGRLREGLSGLSRAGLFVVTRSAPADGLRTLIEVVRAHNPAAPNVRAHQSAVGVTVPGGPDGLEPLPAPRTARVGGFCAIGNPEAFRLDLLRIGFELALFEAFRDHHRYTGEEIRSLSDRARQAGAAYLLTTEKDLARMTPGLAPPGSLPLKGLRIQYDIDPPEPFTRAIETAAGLAS
jgi:tetraacyldisaccharide 4'-kinase